MTQVEGFTLLSDAQSLVASSWTQYADARAADGTVVDPWSEDAVSWSLLGALVASYERQPAAGDQALAVGAVAGACLLLGEVLDGDSLSDWNDAAGRTQADVLEVLDDALTTA